MKNKPVEFTDLDQGHTFESRKEAYQYLNYAVRVVVVFILLSVLCSIVENI